MGRLQAAAAMASGFGGAVWRIKALDSQPLGMVGGEGWVRGFMNAAMQLVRFVEACHTIMESGSTLQGVH